jgi:hypothetical protein
VRRSAGFALRLTLGLPRGAQLHRAALLAAGAALVVPHAAAHAQDGGTTAPDLAEALSPDIEWADEPQLLAAHATVPLVFRLKPAPQVLVMVFPSLMSQGLTLNRVGAFVEQAGQPHDRVLDDAGLALALAASHVTMETYYYGHDYRAADLLRFFATARRDGVTLHPEEAALEAMLRRERLLVPGAVGALISVPAGGDSPMLDPAARATILRHEISHGVYFTDPTYAAYVRQFWETEMTEEERAHFRRYLGAEGYDTGIEDLMRNEAQAYLVFTADPRFFTPAAVALPTPVVAELRQRFVAGMPPSWLRDRMLEK